MAKKGIEIALKVGEILDNYSEETKRAIVKAQEKVGREVRDRLRDTSPRKTDDYTGGWAIKREREEGGLTIIVYNKEKPGFTHLLENSHVIKNKSGAWGRTSPGHGQIVHIKPAEEWGIEEFERRVREAIENERS